MLRQKWGSVVCPGCKNLVGVQDDRCLNCGRWNPGLWGFAPLLNRFGRDLGFTPLVMWSCIGIYVATLLVGGPQFGGLLSFLSPRGEALLVFGMSGGIPVFREGRWWTVLTAGWLHGGILHILMNMMALRNIAPAVAEFYGPSRMAIIYIVSGAAGFTLSSVNAAYLGIPRFGGAYTVGASASIMGLVGALIFYGRRTGSRMIGDQAKQSAIMMIIIGFLLPFIDNGAHLGGLAGGYLSARFLDPLYPERLDHLIIALTLFLITGVAIVFSIVTSLQIF